MKRNYFDPEMKISTFSVEDVVTVSGEGISGVSDTSAQTGYETAAGGYKAETTYSTLQFN